MNRRLTQLRDGMASSDLDAIIATSYASFYYLTGVPIFPYGRPMAALVPREGEPTIVASVIEQAHARTQAYATDLRFYWDYNPEPEYENPRPPPVSLVHHLRCALAERNLLRARIGIEERMLPLEQHSNLCAALPRATLVGASDLVDRLRIVHSDEELHLIRSADKLADLGLATFLDTVAPGATAEGLARSAREQMIDAALTQHPGAPFFARVDPGLGGTAKGAGHSYWTTWNHDDRAQAGQLLTPVVSAWLWGYDGNVERTIWIGEPTDPVRRCFDVMVEANEAAIAAIRPGVTLAQIDRVCKEVLARHGFSTRTGSGVGRGITDYQANARELLVDVRLYQDLAVTPGMVFSIEPNIELEGVGTFRHCNTVIVTATGCEVDSSLPRGPIWR